MNEELFSTATTPELESEDWSRNIRLVLAHTNETMCGNYCPSDNVFYSSDDDMNRCYYWESSLGRWRYVDDEEESEEEDDNKDNDTKSHLDKQNEVKRKEDLVEKASIPTWFAFSLYAMSAVLILYSILIANSLGE